MPSVTLRIAPWLSQSFGAAGMLVLKEEIAEGENLLAFLRRMFKKNRLFEKEVYDSQENQLLGGILIVFNGRVVPHADLDKHQLTNEDKITVSPTHTGG